MAKNTTPDFDGNEEDTSVLDDMSARESRISKLDSILSKKPGRVGEGLDLTPTSAEERSDDRRLAMEERRRVRNSRIEAGAAKDSARIRRAAGIEPETPKQAPRKQNTVTRAIREEPDFEPEAPTLGRASTASEAGAWLRDNPGVESGMREMGRAIDPNAAAAHRARTLGRGSVFEFGSREHVGSFDPMSASKSQDVVGNERIGGMGGIMSGQENAAISTDFDPADTGPRIKGSAAFAEPSHIASPFEKFKETASSEEKLGSNVGRLYLRQAGRCDHPLCQMKRARGLELMGRPVSSRSFGKGIESPLPPIPSVAKSVVTYPQNPQTGKQDRKNPSISLDIRPADPKGAAWKEAQSMLDTTSDNLFSPDDLLEHHHGPEDMDFERHLPWHPNYRGPQ